MAEQEFTSDAEVVCLPRLVEELRITPRQIMAVARLLSDGNTIPFIARYRKEVHGNLDEVQISAIQERLTYYRDLEERRAVILKSIEDQGKLTPELQSKIMGCLTKTALEDLYLPYKPKRRTRAMIAREKGLEPLADAILTQKSDKDPEEFAALFINSEKGVDDTAAALAGACDIVAEIISENADIRGMVRQKFATEGIVVSEVLEPKPDTPTKFEQYYDFKEKLSDIPSHRLLAIRRGQAEGVLKVYIACDAEAILRLIGEMVELKLDAPYGSYLQSAITDSYKRLIQPSVEVDVAVEAKMRADRAAVEIFAQNLRNLLLQSPLGERKIIGIDPGLRTGCKCVALDATGKFLGTSTFYLVKGERGEIEAKVELCKLIARFQPQAIAVGNGTGGRETEAFVRNVLKEANFKEIMVVSVNEAGASVYSASEVAREEFPDLDLTIRGAISIGRRLQDPLAELVKIEPKSIGVGQYQHDVHQPLLGAKLDEVVVSCVNHVGVEVNTASAPLLTRVSGIGSSLAKKLVHYRNENGAFKSRRELSKVPGLGPKTFEQAAGFLRIRDGEHPLDSSAVHPERYALVERMATDLGVALTELIGNGTLIGRIPLAKYVSAGVGEPTLRDIAAELLKPGRDPRATFEKPAFREDVTELEHLKEGMVLEGIVTNVTAFGAFVDIGVHQDGLVHVSELSNRYVKDPAEVVKAGDRVKVRVVTIDAARRRISLSAKFASVPESSTRKPGAPAGKNQTNSYNSGRASGERGARDFSGGRDQRRGGAFPSTSKGFNINPFAGL